MPEKTENTKAPLFELQCENCNRVLTFSDFAVSIVLHGLIILDSPNVLRFGCTCRFCKEATLIKKFSKKSPLPEDVTNLYNCISESKCWYYDCITDKEELGFSPIDSMFSGEWKYNSFPYFFAHPREAFVKSVNVAFFSEIIDTHPYEILDRHFPAPPNPTTLLEELIQNSCFPFITETLDTPPFSLLLGFKEDEIDELVAFENKQKKKVFPRYMLYDQELERIQSFCWTNKLQWAFYEKMGASLKNQQLLMTSKKRIVQERNDFMNIIDQTPAYELYIGERLIRYFSLHHSLSQEQIFEQMILPSNKDSIYPSRKTRKRMAEKIWNHFNKDYIQEMLLTRADKFILELIELSESISFSWSLLWDIKDKYLFELHNAVTSKYQRRVEQNKDKEYWQKQAQEAEKSFPDIKILSQSQDLNKMKVTISNLPKLINDGFRGPILLLGEKGTGKSYFAKAIHSASKRTGEFITVDCGAISENLFESELFGHLKGAFTGATQDRKGAFETASCGTLFLDEIGNIPKTLQQKLLRVLQEREYQTVGSSKLQKTDAFIIVATNANLEQMVVDNEFRGDLLDRIDKLSMTIPPLRKRKMDIPLYLDCYKKNLPVDPNLNNDLKKLKYDWPGNVRELINVIEKTIMDKTLNNNSSPICFEDFLKQIKVPIQESKESNSIAAHAPKGPGNTKVTPEQVRHAMSKNNGNKTKAAKELGVTYHTIHRRCKKLGI